MGRPWWRWGVWGIVGLLLAWQDLFVWQDGGDWAYLVRGGHLIVGDPAASGYDDAALPIGVDTGRGGLQLYGDHPEMQIGPLALLVARLAMILPVSEPFAIKAVGLALGVAVLLLVESMVKRATTAHWLLGGSIITVCWVEITAIWAHIDDAIVVVAALALTRLLLAPPPALVWRTKDLTPYVAGLFVGVGCAAKPIAIPLLFLIAALPSRRTTAVLTAVMITATAWLPFILADPSTLAAGAYRIVVRADSLLGLFGFAGEPTPTWTRVGQLVAACAGAWWFARRGQVVPALVAISVGRLIFEPGWVPYHVAPLVIALVLWELREATWRLPLLSAAAVALLVESPRLGLPGVGWLRLVGIVGVCVALALELTRCPRPVCTSMPETWFTTAKVGSVPRLTE